MPLFDRPSRREALDAANGRDLVAARLNRIAGVVGAVVFVAVALALLLR